MVESKAQEFTLQTDPKHTVQEMQFKCDETTNTFVGLLIRCKEEIYAIPNQSAFDQNQVATITQVIDFKDKTYLKSLTVWTSQGQIKKLAFQFCDSLTNSAIEEQFVGEEGSGCDMKKCDSDNGHFLNIFNVGFTSALKSMNASQCLLPSFNPQTLVLAVINQNENYIINYSDMKKLEGLIPPNQSVTDEDFKSLFNKVRTAINQVSLMKAQISDSFQDNQFFIESLEVLFGEIAKAVGPSIAKGSGKFNANEFPREKQKLQELLNQLNECFKKIKELEPKVASLRVLREDIQNLKKELFNDEKTKHTLRMYNNNETLKAMAEGAINKERSKHQEVKAELNIIIESLPKLEDQMKLFEKLIEEKKQSREEVSRQSLAVSKHAMNSKFEDLTKANQLSGAQKLDDLDQEFQETITDLQTEYNRKKFKLEKRIENERDKMSSNVTVQTGSGQKQKSHHFILILDESGSMQGSWSQLRDVFNKFIDAFKQDETPHIFSVILFDHGGRILYKRAKAKDIGDLGQLQGGGTTYQRGLVLAQQLVNITQGQSPVILFMTDGGTDQNDINASSNILKAISSCSQYKDGMFFSIGFGTGYNRSVLEQLANAANGGKKSITIGSAQYESVLEAIDEKELLDIFLGISNTFEKSAQEAAVDALERQRKIDENMFNQQLQFYRDQQQKRIEDLKKGAAFRNEMKTLAENGKADELKELIQRQEQQLDLNIADLQTKLEKIIQDYAKMKARQDVLNKEIKELSDNVEDAKETLEQDASSHKLTCADHKKNLNDLLTKSKLQDLEGIRTLYNHLGSIDGTIENLIQSVKNAKNLLLILKRKIDDLLFHFEGDDFAKKLSKGLTDAEIAERIIKVKNLDEALKGKVNKDILKEALMRNCKDFADNEKFYDKLLDWLDFTAVATCRKSKLSKYARLYARKLSPKVDRILGDSDDSDASDDDDGNDSDNNGVNKVSMKDLIKNPEEDFDIEPLFKSDVEKKVDSKKRKMKELKKKKIKEKATTPEKEKWKKKLEDFKLKKRKLASESKYYRVILNEELLTETIEICLRNIHDILAKAVGEDIVKRIYNDFKNVFGFFQEYVQAKLLPFERTVELLSLENEKEIQKAIEDIYDQKNKLAIAQAQETSQQVKGIGYTHKDALEDMDMS